MTFMDILQQYVNAPQPAASDVATSHFEQVAQTAPRQVIQAGVAEAFRSDQTPPLEQMVAQLFGQSTPAQKAGLLTQLSQLIPPNSPAGNMLQSILGKLNGDGTAVTPAQATQVSSDQVQEAVTHAAQQNPGIIDKLSEFYAQHPGLVKTLGSAALTIALAKMATRARG